MLAAAWGPSIPGLFRALWMNFGALGLVSAIGLDVTWRIRQFQKIRRRARVVEQRVRKVLTPLAATGAEASRIRNALQRIAEDYQKGLKHGHDGRFEPRIPVQIPAHLRPVGDDGERRSPIQQHALKVVISEFSSRGIRLSHENLLNHDTVVVSFDLLDGQTMSLTAQLHWTQDQDDGTFASGGTVLDFYPQSGHSANSF
jgi:hypothetical protein